MAFPNATIDKLESMLARARKDLADFEQWKADGKPKKVWFHRSAGTWARNTIREVTDELKRRGVTE